RDVSIVPAIGRHFTTIKGHCTELELETALQWIYLLFTAPRINNGSFPAYLQELKSGLHRRDAYAVFRDSIARMTGLDESGWSSLTSHDIDGISLSKMMDAWR